MNKNKDIKKLEINVIKINIVAWLMKKDKKRKNIKRNIRKNIEKI